MASTARMEKQVDREFIIKKLDNRPPFVVINYADAIGSPVPERLQGLWTSEGHAKKAIDSWRTALSNQLTEA